MHRTPWVLIVSGVVGLIVVMAGCGTALAVLGHNTGTATGGLTTLPSPTPATSPSPVASPVSSGGSTASNVGVTVPVPSGWTVASQDSESITLTDPYGTGAVTVASGISNPSQTAQQNMDSINRTLQSKYPDTRICAGTQVVNSSFNGAPGIFWTLCMTVTSGAQSAPLVASMFAGANANGSVYYAVMVVTREGNLQGFTNTAKPVLQGIHWKL